jgi:FlaG/FlaF family flagellin (archaellin)
MKSNQKAILGRKEAGVSAVIGVILMLAITVGIASVVYYEVSAMTGKSNNIAPTVAFIKGGSTSNGTLTVASVSGTYQWSDFSDIGTLVNTSATVKAGDYFYGLTGEVKLIYQDNSLLGTWTFP